MFNDDPAEQTCDDRLVELAALLALDTRRSLAKHRGMPWHVYILECRDGHRYVGMASDLGRRLADHRKGKVRSTKGRLPVRLVYFEEVQTSAEARRRERSFKSGRTRRETIEYMIATFPAEFLSPFA